MKKSNEKRITFIVTERFHQEIKQRSLDRGVTMTRYIHRSLWQQLKEELKYDQQIERIDSHDNQEQSVSNL